jgi:hypothetical protein
VYKKNGFKATRLYLHSATFESYYSASLKFDRLVRRKIVFYVIGISWRIKKLRYNTKSKYSRLNCQKKPGKIKAFWHLFMTTKKLRHSHVHWYF